MKKTDIAMIVLIASVSVVIAFLIARSLPFLQVSKTGEKAQTVEKINSAVVAPDKKIFNNSSINPTVETVIGDAAAQ